MSGQALNDSAMTGLTLSDPIIQILRLAYRRGLALRQEHAKQSETAHPENLAEDAGRAADEGLTPEEVSHVQV